MKTTQTSMPHLAEHYAGFYHGGQFRKKTYQPYAMHPARVADLMKQFGITHLADKWFTDLSAGEKTRVNLCKSLINDPEILLLDEPTASLDPSIAAQVRDSILDMQKKRKMTVIFTSHNMPEVEQMCDRVALLHKGKIYMIDTPENLVKAHAAPDLEEVFIRLAKGEFET